VTQEESAVAATPAPDEAAVADDSAEQSAVAPDLSGYAVDPQAYQVASTGRRLGAWLLDLLVVVVLLSVVGVIFGAWQPVTRTITNDDGTVWTASTYYLDTVWSYSLMAFFSLLAIPFWKMRGATPAQRLLGLRVLDATGPRLLSWPQAAIRWLLLYGWTLVGIASSVTVGLSIVVLVWLVGLMISELNGYRNQGFHDQRAQSVVVSPRTSHRPAWS
jgi:uncharacterized RDD family membrane protein YckC